MRDPTKSERVKLEREEANIPILELLKEAYLELIACASYNSEEASQIGTIKALEATLKEGWPYLFENYEENKKLL